MSDCKFKLNDFRELEKKKVFFSIKNFIWYVFGFLGNLFYKQLPPNITSHNGKRYLNLGSGDCLVDGFVNADFFRLHKLLSKNRASWFLDLNKLPLKCESDYWDGVVMVHVNEHLSYVNNYLLLTELHRVLKKGAVLRIVMPDLDKYLAYQEDGKNSELKMNRYKSLPEAISNLTQNHAHISTWNYKLMETVLYEIGFISITRCDYLEGANKDLLIDGLNHKWQSFYIEAKK